MDNIIKLLCLEDPDLEILDVSVHGRTREITMARALRPQFCPICQSRMYSRGIYQRKVRHPVLQDGRQLVLHLRQRRFQCSSPACAYTCNEEYPFVGRYSQRTKATDLMVLDAFRDAGATAGIARRSSLSDTTVLQIFDRYVDMKPLPLSEVISIDEVHLDIPRVCKYALVIMDFLTGEPIDMLPGRKTGITEPYFASLPPEGRSRVRYLITDMYNPYLSFAGKYFPKALPVVDSFHVVQWLVRGILNRLNLMQKEYRSRDEQRKREARAVSDAPLRFRMSDEAYLLKHHKRIMLRNPEHIRYNAPSRYDKHFRCMMDAYAYEERFFRAFPMLRDLRDLKDRYILFNQSNAGRPDIATVEIEKLISLYQASGFEELRKFSGLLRKYKQPVINSFVLIAKDPQKGKMLRLSNGPIESLNRKPKDQKRNARGYLNFEHARNRFLFATRMNAPILAAPKEKEDIMNPTGKERGCYRKKAIKDK